MSFRFLIFLSGFLALVLGANATLVPGQLRVEYLRSPLGLDAPAPRLSWIVTSPERGAKQAAYQVVVASTQELLQTDHADLWDSGKVQSDATAQIGYGGGALKSNAQVWWKVRVWDQADGVSPWSAPEFWEMGLLTPADWHGRWIARAAFTGKPQPLPLFRRAISLEGKIKRARVYAAGLGYFELSINGRRIGDHLLDPAFTRYDRRILYVTHDVTDALRHGENVVGVMLGNGWFNVEARAPWNFDQAPWRASPRLLLEMRVEFEDGRTLTLASDENWKTSDGPIFFSGIYGGENHDARLEQSGWDAPGFDDHIWSPALPVDAPKGKLAAQAMPAIALDRVITPVTVSEPTPGVFVFDAGQNLTGNAELQIEGPAGTTLTMVYSEKLGARGRVDQSNIDVYSGRYAGKQQFQTDTYVLKGQGVEHWHSRFAYHGFRYVEITGAPGKLTADNLAIRFYHSAVSEAGGFECSNPVLNRTWINGRWSYFSNLFGIPTDCPHREKNGWTGDAQIGCEQGLFYADGITVYEKWITDLADEQFITGALPGIVPTNGLWGYAFGSGPAWDSAFLLIPWHLHEYYGDDSALRKNYPGYKRYVDYLTTRANDGILEIGLGDWCFWKTETPVEVTDTGYYYRAANIVATVARWLGHENDAKKYAALAQSIRAAFNRKFYHQATGSYSNGSQTALGCALFQGLAEAADEPRVVSNLVAEIAKNGNHLDFGLLGSKYVLNSLTAHGRTDVAYAMAGQKTQPGWGWWLEQGATTLWETWTGDGSQNHTFLGDVNAWMIKALAGINPDPAAPGFKHIVIAPNPVGDLTSAKAHYDSVRGRILSDWTLEGRIFRLKVAIPANCSATVYLPALDAASITESDKTLAMTEGVTLIGIESGRAKIEIGAGTYFFQVSSPAGS